MPRRAIVIPTAITLTVVFGAALTAQQRPAGAGRTRAATAAVSPAPSPDGATPLHRAVEAGDVARVRQLIAAGADVNAATRYDVRPLSMAVMAGNAALVAALLDAGADPNALMGEGEPVLMTAARHGNPDVVRALIAAGADPDVRERFYGQTPMMWAAVEDHADVIHALAEAGGTVNTRADVLEGEPMWRYAADRRNGINGEALQNFNTNFSKGGLTPLMYAARQGSTNAVRALMDRGADPAAADPEGFTPLLLAIMNTHYDTAAVLVEKGADVNQAVEDNGQTPLFSLVDQRSLLWVYNRPTPKARNELTSLDLAKRLLDAGARVDAPLSGRARRAMGGGGSALTGPGATAFLRAAVVSDLPMMRLLLERGADPKVTTKAGVTAMHAVAGLNWVDNTMSTAVGLGFATEEDSIGAITLLLEKGLDVNAEDNQGNTPMHGAASRGANSVVKFLAERGAKLDARTKPRRIAGNVNDNTARTEPGRSPIDVALLANPPREETVRLIRTLMGEDPNAPLPTVEAPEAEN